MTDIWQYDGKISIIIGDGKFLKVIHTGMISLKLTNINYLELKNTLYVLHLRKNLISIH